MKTEQVINELEGLVQFLTCPSYIKDALALIKEQQAQIKVLEADRNNYKEWYVQAVGEIKELQAHNENLENTNKYLRERLAEEMEHEEDMKGE